jgi:hypothetical protein
MKKYSKDLFIHFDEVDLILDILPKIEPNGEKNKSITRFYQFWELINPIVFTGGFVYCSGRSPYLYYLGKDFFKPHTRFSSGTVAKH